MMKRKGSNKLSSFILCMTLTVAMALLATGCNGKAGKGASSQGETAGVEAGASKQIPSQGGKCWEKAAGLFPLL